MEDIEYEGYIIRIKQQDKGTEGPCAGYDHSAIPWLGRSSVSRGPLSD